MKKIPPPHKFSRYFFSFYRKVCQRQAAPDPIANKSEKARRRVPPGTEIFIKSQKRSVSAAGIEDTDRSTCNCAAPRGRAGRLRMFARRTSRSSGARFPAECRARTQAGRRTRTAFQKAYLKYIARKTFNAYPQKCVRRFGFRIAGRQGTPSRYRTAACALVSQPVGTQVCGTRPASRIVTTAPRDSKNGGGIFYRETFCPTGVSKFGSLHGAASLYGTAPTIPQTDFEHKPQPSTGANTLPGGGMHRKQDGDPTCKISSERPRKAPQIDAERYGKDSERVCCKKKEKARHTRSGSGRHTALGPALSAKNTPIG